MTYLVENLSFCLHSWHCPIWKTVSKAQLKNFDGIFFSTLRIILTLTCTINDLAHQLQIAISSWEMLRFLLPIQSFIVLMGFVSLLAIPGHKSCKKVALVNSYLAPRQKKDKLEKSRKHFRTKQSSNWNYNCTKKTVSPFWLIGCFSSQCSFLTILKVFYFNLNSKFHPKNSIWLDEQFMKIRNSWNHLVSRSFYKNFLSKMIFIHFLASNFLALKMSFKGQFWLEHILARFSCLINCGIFFYNRPLW